MTSGQVCLETFKVELIARAQTGVFQALQKNRPAESSELVRFGGFTAAGLSEVYTHMHVYAGAAQSHSAAASSDAVQHVQSPPSLLRVHQQSLCCLVQHDADPNRLRMQGTGSYTHLYRRG